MDNNNPSCPLSFPFAPLRGGDSSYSHHRNYIPSPPPPPHSSSNHHNFQFNLFNHLPPQLTDWLSTYKQWITHNPGKASDIESFFKVLAYLLPGRIRGNSTVIPELLYSTANLISFWHDQILQKQLDLLDSLHNEQYPAEDINGHRGNNNGTPVIGLEDNHQNNCPTIKRRRNIFRVRVALTVLEYFEVFLEVAARRLWGEAGKWLVIFVVQAVK